MTNQNLNEQDYQRLIVDVTSTRFLPSTHIEIIQECNRDNPPLHALFDFDGTVSLIREGWQSVMIPMMVDEILTTTSTSESCEELTLIVRDFVDHLTGKQTIYQMMRLGEEIQKRGGSPEEPIVYKHRYHDRLMQRIHDRREGLRTGTTHPEEMLVPYTIKILEALYDRGIRLYLASGTDEKYVIEEAELLGLNRFFGPHIYGAQDNYLSFSKKRVIERILKENAVDGSRLIGFGDGYVEIENVKSVGGIAVAVATDEAKRSGHPDTWKRERLIGIGADIVIPDYHDYKILLRYLWNEL